MYAISKPHTDVFDLDILHLYISMMNMNALFSGGRETSGPLKELDLACPAVAVATLVTLVLPASQLPLISGM